MADDATPFKVMVVEDDDDVARAIARKLGADGLEVELASDPRGVIARLDADLADWHVVILDVGLPGISGIDVLKNFKRVGSLASVIMLTGDRSAATATTCMRAGAFYYITKPFEPFELSAVVASAARHSTLQRELAGVKRQLGSDQMLVGQSAPMRRLKAAIERLGEQGVAVLIQGESGTGKEL